MTDPSHLHTVWSSCIYSYFSPLWQQRSLSPGRHEGRWKLHLQHKLFSLDDIWSTERHVCMTKRQKVRGELLSFHCLLSVWTGCVCTRTGRGVCVCICTYDSENVFSSLHICEREMEMHICVSSLPEGYRIPIRVLLLSVACRSLFCPTINRPILWLPNRVVSQTSLIAPYTPKSLPRSALYLKAIMKPRLANVYTVTHTHQAYGRTHFANSSCEVNLPCTE